MKTALARQANKRTRRNEQWRQQTNGGSTLRADVDICYDPFRRGLRTRPRWRVWMLWKHSLSRLPPLEERLYWPNTCKPSIVFERICDTALHQPPIITTILGLKLQRSPLRPWECLLTDHGVQRCSRLGFLETFDSPLLRNPFQIMLIIWNARPLTQSIRSYMKMF